jgi:hypothetical protein
MLGGVWSFRPKSGWVSTSSLALVVAVARRQASTKAFGHSSFYVLLLSVLFVLCVLALCALALGAPVLCALVLGTPHYLCSCSKRSSFSDLLLLAILALCAFDFDISHSMCSCFQHSSLYVFLLLAFLATFRVIGGNCCC